MENSPATWRARCRQLGLDPQQVKSVSKRYDMYKSYTDDQGGDTLPLDRWYKWYRVEKLSEGHAMLTPPAEGCSVSGNTDVPEQQGAIVSEPEFLALLQLYRGA